MEGQVDDEYRETTSREILLRLAHASRLGAALGRIPGTLPVRWGLDGDEEDEELDMEEQTEQEEEPSTSGQDQHSLTSGSPSVSFLFPGRAFSGKQRLIGPRREQEDWSVTATLYSYDVERGRLSGQMIAHNGPLSKRPIITYFEGEIIDNVNFSFWTGSKWGSSPSRETDMRYWSRCPGFTPTLRASVLAHDGRAPQLGCWRHVFMRWKECFFVDVPQDCPLTITGFYYLSLDRATGAIGGFYFDARSAPLQELQLQPIEYCSGADSGGAGASGSEAGSAGMEPPAGMAFGAYSLC